MTSRFRDSVSIAAAAALVGLVVASCTGSSPAAMPSSPPGSAGPRSTSVGPAVEQPSNPAAERCLIVSAGLVGQAFGVDSVMETVGTTPLGRPQCTFTMRKTNAGPGGQVTAVRSTHSSARAFRQIQAANSGANPVPRLGDRAFYVPRTSTVQFQRGSTIIMIAATIRVPGAPVAKPAIVRGDLIKLARLVAAQM